VGALIAVFSHDRAPSDDDQGTAAQTDGEPTRLDPIMRADDETRLVRRRALKGFE
jgi:hypothetical protein